jgi:hypothetical protein
MHRHYIASTRIFMTDDTKWHRRLILPVYLDGDCIPLNSSTGITTAEANGNESTAISADRFLYTKAPRLYSEMYIQVHNVSNRDVKDDRVCVHLYQRIDIITVVVSETSFEIWTFQWVSPHNMTESLRVLSVEETRVVHLHCKIPKGSSYK